MQRQIESLRAKRLLLKQLYQYIIGARRCNWIDYFNLMRSQEFATEILRPIEKLLLIHPDPQIKAVIYHLNQARADRSLLDPNPDFRKKVLEPLEESLAWTKKDECETKAKIRKFQEQTKGETSAEKSSSLKSILRIGSIVSGIGGIGIATYFVASRRKNGQTDKK